MLGKRVNKRGQELSISTLVLIVLGIIVLVMIVIGFTRGWDFIFGKIDLLPGQNLEAVAQSCKVSAQNGLRIDYCSFKEVEVDGDTQYVNCDDPRVAAAIAQDLPDLAPIDCAGLGTEYTRAGYCQSARLRQDVLVNNNACGQFGIDFSGPPTA